MMKPLVVYLESGKQVSPQLLRYFPGTVMPYNRWPRTCTEIVAYVRATMNAIDEEESAEALSKAARTAELLLGEPPVAIIVVESGDDKPTVMLVGAQKSLMCASHIEY